MIIFVHKGMPYSYDQNKMSPFPSEVVRRRRPLKHSFTETVASQKMVENQWHTVKAAGSGFNGVASRFLVKSSDVDRLLAELPLALGIREGVIVKLAGEDIPSL